MCHPVPELTGSPPMMVLLPSGDCIPDPCQNGGTCIEEGDHPECLCLPGYGGDACEIGEWPCPPLSHVPMQEGMASGRVSLVGPAPDAQVPRDWWMPNLCIRWASILYIT